MKITKIFTLTFVLASMLFQLEALAQTSTNKVEWFSFNMGFANSGLASTTIKSAVGQAFVGTTQQGNMRLECGLLAFPWFRIIDGVSESEGGEEISTHYELQQNYPNPFNPSTTISFALPKSSNVTLKLFDMFGRELATLAQGKFSAGRHHVVFDATSFSSGVYFYRLQAKEFSQTRRLTLIK